MDSSVQDGVAPVKGERFLSKTGQYNIVYSGGKSWAGKELVLRALPNALDSSRFGFVVSRRLGKAVVRNRIKRRLREIARQMPVQPGWDIIFIARIPALKADYNDLERSIRTLLSRADINIVGENEGHRSVAD